MRVTVGSRLWVDDPSDELLMWCRKNLIIFNPEYVKRARMGFWVKDTPRELCLTEWDGDTLVLPYGCLRSVLSFDGCEVYHQFRDPVMVDFKCNIPLYDYQQEAVTIMQNAYYGILQSPPGSGKTQMGLALARTLGRRTLWLTHTKDLLVQSQNRAEQYMPSTLTGTITAGQVRIGKAITFATVQTMCRLDLSLYTDVWDCIIVDECHRVSGTPTTVTQYSKVLNALAARHKYGLTGTPTRIDGMIKTTFALLGEVAHQVPQEAVMKLVVPVSILPRSTGMRQSIEFLDTDGTVIYAKLLNYLVKNVARNNLILGDLVRNSAHFNLVLSDQLDHLEYLLSHLPPALKSQAVMVDARMVSKQEKAQRQQAIEDLRAGRKHYLFATYALAKEGLDIPRLDRLYLTTPRKTPAVIAQSIGRIARAFEGKGTPVVYDYVDTYVESLAKSYKKRCTTYRKCGCKFLDREVGT